MFRAGLLPSIRRINTVQTAVGIVMRYVDWLRAAIPNILTAVYTELTVLMMSNKAARNM